jgi:hypothetical protein
MDEGPTENTKFVLDALNINKTKVTFHFSTAFLQQQVVLQAFVKKAFSDGHLIGLRYPTAANLVPTKISDDKFMSVLLDESAKLGNYLTLGGEPIFPKFLRLPSGQTQEKHVAMAQSLGFQVTNWNLDFFDDSVALEADTAKLPILDFMSQKAGKFIDEQGDGRSSFIALLHDRVVAYQNQSILPGLVKYLEGRKFKMVTLDRCLNFNDMYRKSNKDKDGKDVRATSESSTKMMLLSGTLSLVAMAVVFFF